MAVISVKSTRQEGAMGAAFVSGLKTLFEDDGETSREVPLAVEVAESDSLGTREFSAFADDADVMIDEDMVNDDMIVDDTMGFDASFELADVDERFWLAFWSDGTSIEGKEVGKLTPS